MQNWKEKNICSLSYSEDIRLGQQSGNLGFSRHENEKTGKIKIV